MLQRRGFFLLTRLHAPAVGAACCVHDGASVRAMADDESADNLDAGAAARVEGAAVGAVGIVNGDGAVVEEHGDGGAVCLRVDGIARAADAEAVGSARIIGADIAVPDGEGGDTSCEGGQGSKAEQGSEEKALHGAMLARRERHGKGDLFSLFSKKR